ncbi:cellobiose dehydrogenase [Pseudomassariella vexata]|uniref:Cellobiose dehydrogenase n=1 Tax=Pseudomassariella vexata TaxID=1141098 RepID=A0A1Y2E3U6_9PEZI|nr:cellobiose dehydrogenase [Pseudomassariella vexata]ORY65545.1 cellobiose dehydrogenase [Pseudomassariella vexata]
MKGFVTVGAAFLAASSCILPCVAQRTTYTDTATGISFGTWTEGGGAFTYGIALPGDALTTDATEYIGLLRCTAGWCGISHGESGQMTQSLLLMAWPYQDQVLTSFRFATGYNLPAGYTGDAKLTQISSKIDGSTFEIIYRCQNCFSWNQDGATGEVSTTGGNLIMGWALAAAVPINPGCPNSISFRQHDSAGQYGAALDGVNNASYSTWTSLATKTPSGDCGGATTTTTTSSPTVTPTSTVPAPTVTCISPSKDTYDYIVVGAGAGGIPVADRLSEAGHSVLLIEKGPPSSGRYGGTMKPEWLEGTNLTRFDVPGLCNQIWVDSAGIACTDTDQMAGCVLGGGTAVNAGLWWKPNPVDWDVNFPVGWRSTDVLAATNKAFTRIPGTDNPSADGVLYQREGFDILSSGLEKAGWKNVKPNEQPSEKNHTYGRTNYMYFHGERDGPMATYLASSIKRPKFELWMNTAVNRVIRNGSHITGVELACNGNDGYLGKVSVTPDTGRVILSAGTFGSAKLLLRSGIGPADQLAVVANSSDGATMIPQSDWINLPVGHNLIDHLNTDVYVTHPDFVFYDFYGAWTDPIPSDKEKYLTNRTGIFTQAAPNIGPMFWDEIPCSDGVTRQLHYTSRVEGEDKTGTNNTMIMSQYLGRGSTSRGRMGITAQLNTIVAEHPYLHTPGDKEAVLRSIDNVRAAFTGLSNLTFALPMPNQTTLAYVDSLVISPAARRANHWMGTAKLGLDDGRKENGTAVVDVDTKVYGTDNLFVVDASIFPGMSTGNPAAMIVAASEYAAQRILQLPTGVKARDEIEAYKIRGR